MAGEFANSNASGPRRAVVRMFTAGRVAQRNFSGTPLAAEKAYTHLVHVNSSQAFTYRCQRRLSGAHAYGSFWPVSDRQAIGQIFPIAAVRCSLLLQDAGVRDHLRPACGFRTDELREFFPAGRGDFDHHILKSLLDLGQAQHRGEIGMNFVEDRRGRAGRRTQPVPGIHFETGKRGLVYGRHQR